ncbi:MAG: hypothetical protein FWH11_11205 [Micrococcales bacterium]|nr:hypothetical protein [Micrococcales bacterium]
MVDQYTVGVEAGEVVIFHGEDIVELTGIDVNALPPYLRDRVDATILAENLEAAHTMVEDLRTEVQPASSPTP